MEYEDVMKDLNYWTSNAPAICGCCPFNDKPFYQHQLMIKALELIKQQQEKINSLVEQLAEVCI